MPIRKGKKNKVRRGSRGTGINAFYEKTVRSEDRKTGGKLKGFWKRALAMVLIVTMMIGVLPMNALAAVGSDAGWSWNDDKSVLYVKDGSISQAQFHLAIRGKLGDPKGCSGSAIAGGYSADLKYVLTSNIDWKGFESNSTSLSSTSTNIINLEHDKGYTVGVTNGKNAYTGKWNTGEFTVKHYYEITVDIVGA